MRQHVSRRADGDGGVVAHGRFGSAVGGDFWVADCHDAGEAGGGFLRPFGGWPGLAGFEEGADRGERGEVVAF